MLSAMRRAAAVLLLLSSWRAAEACICAPAFYDDRDALACEEFARDKAIFAGTAVSVVKTDQLDTTTFAVLEPFRGAIGVTVNTIGGSDCDPKFDVGNSYLVYAFPYDTHPDRLGARGCGISLPLERATLDLKYARAGGREKRIFLGGWVQVFPRTAALDENRGGLPGVPITISGPGGTRRLLSGAAGKFRMDDPAPGRYVIHADLPPPFRAQPDPTVVVREDACAVAIALRTDALAEIRGRVVDETGHPRQHVTVTAEPAGAVSSRSGDAPRGETDGLGHYVIRGLAPGGYVLHVKAREQVSIVKPWPYPDAILAGVIDVAGPVDRKVDDLVIPESTKFRVDK